MDTDDKALVAVIAIWLFAVLLNILFWGALIWLGFYAVNEFSG